MEGFKRLDRNDNELADLPCSRAEGPIEYVTLMEEVANPALKERHWKQIFTLLGQSYSSEVPFSTNDLLSYDIMSKIEEVKKYLH
jgi:hypothetical protein